MSQPLRKSARVVSALLAILGSLYALFRLPGELGTVFLLPADSHKWIAITAVGVVVVIFCLVALWLWILSQIRDEPLDGFADYSTAFCRLSELAIPHLRARNSSNTTMAIGLCLKLRVLSQVVTQLDHYGNTALPWLAREVGRETANNPEGLARLGKWVVQYNSDIASFWDSIQPWMEVLEPLLATRVTVDLKVTEETLERFGNEIVRLSQENTKTGEELEKVRGMLVDFSQNINRLSTLFIDKSNILNNDIKACSRLVSSLKL